MTQKKGLQKVRLKQEMEASKLGKLSGDTGNPNQTYPFSQGLDETPISNSLMYFPEEQFEGYLEVI